jgi:TPR repeat protein
MSPDDHAAMNAGLDAYVAGDAAKAFAAWRGPAERGVAEGQLRLGLLYEKGEGTGQDMIEAYRWLKLASAQGNKRAAAEFKIVSGAMAPSERAMAESLVKTGSKELKNGQ